MIQTDKRNYYRLMAQRECRPELFIIGFGFTCAAYIWWAL